MLVLQDIDPHLISNGNILEIGCGVGRLTPYLAKLAVSYTGLDISPLMLKEARTRCASVNNARFLLSDGVSVPLEAMDKSYALVFALAVFIHCPLDVIRSILTSSIMALQPDGILRMQLLARQDDLTGILSMEAAAQIHECGESVDQSTGDRHLIDECHFKGHEFKYQEVEPFIKSICNCLLKLLRVDKYHIYAEVSRMVH